MWSSKQTLALITLLAVGCDDTSSDDGGGNAGSSGRAGGGGRAGSSGRAAGSGGAAGRNNDDPRDAGTRDAGDAGDANDADSGDTREVTIRFRPQVFERPFVCGQPIDGVGKPASEVVPVDLRFYVQEVALLDEAGKQVPVTFDKRDPWQAEGVALLDFQNANRGCNGSTADENHEITGRVPAGTYRGIVFSNGVPAELNHADPNTLPTLLQVSDLTWGWLSGFRFFVAEVHSTTISEDEDAGAPGVGMVHIGSTACSGPITSATCKKPNRNRIELKDFDPDNDAVILDVGAIFAGTDVTAESSCHGMGEACGPMFQRLGVDFATGAPNEDQSVYRVGPRE